MPNPNPHLALWGWLLCYHGKGWLPQRADSPGMLQVWEPSLQFIGCLTAFYHRKSIWAAIPYAQREMGSKMR